jgi:hypothetical protein
MKMSPFFAQGGLAKRNTKYKCNRMLKKEKTSITSQELCIQFIHDLHFYWCFAAIPTTH